MFRWLFGGRTAESESESDESGDESESDDAPSAPAVAAADARTVDGVCAALRNRVAVDLVRHADGFAARVVFPDAVAFDAVNAVQNVAGVGDVSLAADGDDVLVRVPAEGAGSRARTAPRAREPAEYFTAEEGDLPGIHTALGRAVGDVGMTFLDVVLCANAKRLVRYAAKPPRGFEISIDVAPGGVVGGDEVLAVALKAHKYGGGGRVVARDGHLVVCVSVDAVPVAAAARDGASAAASASSRKRERGGGGGGAGGAPAKRAR